MQLTVKIKLKTSDGVLKTTVGLGDCSLKLAHDGFVIAWTNLEKAEPKYLEEETEKRCCNPDGTLTFCVA